MTETKMPDKQDILDEVEDITFLPATTVIPRDWDDFFWAVIAENAPFSWGDNEHTLIRTYRLADHIDYVFYDEHLISSGEKKNLLKLLEDLENIHGIKYIDMES